MRRIAATLCVAALLGTGLAARAASDDGCVLDRCADKRPPGAYDRDRRTGGGPRGDSRPGRFDFYVLALSWSPGFCATGGADHVREQCRPGADLGFVVHGLWPQYEHGYPSDCRGTGSPSYQALAATRGLYPNEGLARYEWRKHGTCSGLSPTEYFAAVREARQAVTIPARFADPHQARQASPLEVERAFTDANTRLRPGMLAAICRDQTLDEVRICLSKDLKSFQACPGVVRERCRSGSIDVPAVR